MIKLACPMCHTQLSSGSYGCEYCPQFQYQLTQDIPDLVLPHEVLDPRYNFEAGRYDRIAEAGPGEYAGFATTKPEYRAALWYRLLTERGITEYANVGPGFGLLEEMVAQDPSTPRQARDKASSGQGMDWLALDLSQGFLNWLKDRWPARVCVRGLAERLPLATWSVPCLVADSVFQSIVDREAFLCEAARVCDGWLLFSVAYGWNYPRRPQQGFDVTYPDERAVLRRYLLELGFSVEFNWVNLAEERQAETQDDGDYVYVVCKK